MSKVQFSSDMTVESLGHLGDDTTPLVAAWTSTYDSEEIQKRLQDDKRTWGFRKYLTREKHLVPFEHQVMTFRIDAPIFVTRQILKHRISSISEESGRYSELRPKFWVPGKGRAVKQVGKTGAYEFIYNKEARYFSATQIRKASQDSWERYQYLIDSGVAKEVARTLLPVNIYSSMVITMNTRSLWNFFDLRTRAGNSKPQAEIEEVAQQMQALWKDAYPMTYKAWHEVTYSSESEYINFVPDHGMHTQKILTSSDMYSEL